MASAGGDPSALTNALNEGFQAAFLGGRRDRGARVRPDAGADPRPRQPRPRRARRRARGCEGRSLGAATERDSLLGAALEAKAGLALPGREHLGLPGPVDVVEDDQGVGGEPGRRGRGAPGSGWWRSPADRRGARRPGADRRPPRAARRRPRPRTSSRRRRPADGGAGANRRLGRAGRAPRRRAASECARPRRARARASAGARPPHAGPARGRPCSPPTRTRPPRGGRIAPRRPPSPGPAGASTTRSRAGADSTVSSPIRGAPVATFRTLVPGRRSVGPAVTLPRLQTVRAVRRRLPGPFVL